MAGYGAPGKSATLLHYCGIGKDLIEYTVDRSPYKQGRFLPGTHIPIYHPDRIRETKPDYVVILPWNLKDEIMQQLQYIREWGGKFVVPIPKVRSLLGGTYEGRAILRWCRDAAQGIFGRCPQAYGDDRIAASTVACHEVLCSFRPQGFRPLPWAQRERH